MGIRKHPVVCLCDKPGEQPQGWAGLSAQTCGYSTGNGQRAASLRAGPISPESSHVDGRACVRRFLVVQFSRTVFVRSAQ